MMKLVITAVLTAVFAFFTSMPSADARRRTETVSAEPAEVPFWEDRDTNRRSRQARQQTQQRYESDDEDRLERRASRRIRTASVTDTGGYGVGPRPGKWCGWYMRTRHGGGPEYNVARNWRKRGVALSGPQVGAIVVWNHHVGQITGQADNGKWIVLSGNDSNRVRERARSVAGATFRML